MMWGDGWGMGAGFGWMMLLGGVVPLFFLGVLVLLAVQALGRGRGAAPTSLPPAPPRHETALETAQRRYATGEISRDEFVQLRDDLAGTARGTAST